jgi:putative CocE/NonD family hydrolase
VILERTPYGRARKDEVPGPVRHGYAVVSQDMRGRFDSEGENLPFIGCGWQGHQDGLDTARWVRQQHWCNGRIGTQGGSAGGITQNLLAATAPEGLVCQYISVAAASLYHHAAYVGGALRQCQVENWLVDNTFSAEALVLYKTHPRYDEFWRAFDSVPRHSAMTVPALHVGGWFDTFSLGTVTSFSGRQQDGGEGARGTQKLVMGPWAHGGFKDEGKVGELVFPNARAPAEYGSGRWFEHYLKGVDNGVERLPAVAYYNMGDVDTPGAPGNQWRRSDTWPPACTATRLFLAADRRLVADPPQATGPEAMVAYTFAPADPCPTRGGGNLTIPSGPMDQRPVEGRADVLCFSTAPLPEPIEVTGQIVAKVFLSSEAVDTDLSVRFCDVYPDGRSFLMAEGMLRARYREGLGQDVPLVPATVYPLTVELWPTSVVINTGHRLRVTVTSSNHPRFDVNPGTGKPWVAGEAMRPQRNTIHCGAEHPSHVVLPVPVAPRRAGG